MSEENTTSFDKYAKMYERMKETKPGFNEVSIVNQAEPRIMGDNVISEIDRPVPQQQPNQEEERSTYNEELKQKILDRAKNKGIGIDDNVYSPPKQQKKSTGNLERRVQYLEEALKIVMEQQMKFLREI
jgi:hypothetical protein